MARLREERYTGQVFSCCQHIALPRHQCSAKSRIEEVLLREFPRQNFFHWRRYNTRLSAQVGSRSPPGQCLFWGCRPNSQSGHRGFALLNPRLWLLGVETGHKAVFDLMRIAENVDVIEMQDIKEIVDAGNLPVLDPWFNDVFPFSAHELARKNLLQHWWPQLHRHIHPVPVGGIVYYAAIHESLGIKRFMQRERRTQHPSIELERHRKFRIEIKPSEQGTRVKSGLTSRQA